MIAILHYPTIQIHNGEWLRNAILYWDKIADIVPRSQFEDSNSNDVEYLRSILLMLSTIEMLGES